jgi:hypothetical protein
MIFSTSRENKWSQLELCSGAALTCLHASLDRKQVQLTVKSVCISFPGSFLFWDHRIYPDTRNAAILVSTPSLEYSIPRSVPARKVGLGCTCEAWSHAGRVTRVSFSWLLLFVLWYVDLVSRSTRTPSNQNSKVLWSQNMWPKAALHVLGPLHKITSHDKSYSGPATCSAWKGWKRNITFTGSMTCSADECADSLW